MKGLGVHYMLILASVCASVREIQFCALVEGLCIMSTFQGDVDTARLLCKAGMVKKAKCL